MLPLALALAVSIVPDSPSTAYKQPQIAASGDHVVLTFGDTGTIYFAGSHDGGKNFDKPVAVFPNTSLTGKFPLGRHRGPRIAFSGGDLVITTISGQQGAGRDGDVFAFRSQDGGKTWSPGVRVNDVEGAAREGLHAMTANGKTVFATWLDLRQKGTRLYGSVSRDGGASWSANMLVYQSPDGYICECCHPTAAIAPNGDLVAMWRNWLGGARDMYMTRSADGKTFGKAVKLGSGTWPLNACPMDGGGLAFDSEGKVWSAFRRETSVIFAAPDGRERVLGPGKDPAIASNGKRAAVVWTDGGLRYTFGEGEPQVLDPAGSFAGVTGGSRIYAAWESGGSIRVARLDK